MFKSIRHLTLIGGCILLLAGLMLSCTEQTVKPKKILMNDLTGAIQKVNTYGEDIGEGQKRLRVSDDTFKYCVIVDNKDSSFVVGRARLLGFSADGWSFSTKTQKLKFFMTQKGEMLDDGKYHLIGQEKALDTKTAQALTKKFEASQKELVNLINQTFGPPTGFLLRGWSMYQSRKGITCGFFC